MGTRVLIADEDTKMLILLKDFLEQEEFEVITCENGLDAFNHFLNDTDIDLFIVDMLLPELNGYKLCDKIKEKSEVPVIVLTAKTREVDELYGSHKGADEYISKPFSPTVLVKRVKALLKRSTRDNTIYKDKMLTIDFKNQECTVMGKPVVLSPTEYKLLKYLIKNQNKVVSRRQILNHVWGIKDKEEEQTVDTHINKLRQKLLICALYIKTIHGFGYSFEVFK